YRVENAQLARRTGERSFRVARWRISNARGWTARTVYRCMSSPYRNTCSRLGAALDFLPRFRNRAAAFVHEVAGENLHPERLPHLSPHPHRTLLGPQSGRDLRDLRKVISGPKVSVGPPFGAGIHKDPRRDFGGSDRRHLFELTVSIPKHVVGWSHPDPSSY